MLGDASAQIPGRPVTVAPDADGAVMLGKLAQEVDGVNGIALLHLEPWTPVGDDQAPFGLRNGAVAASGVAEPPEATGHRIRNVERHRQPVGLEADPGHQAASPGTNAGVIALPITSRTASR